MTCTQPATGAQVKHYYDLETVCGVTNATPDWTPLRFTGGNMQPTKDALLSNELNGSRETNSLRLGSKQTTGEIAVELSNTSYDDILEMVMGGTWVAGTDESTQSVTVSASGKTFTRAAGDFTANIAVGDLVQFPGLGAGNNGVFRATAVATTVLTCSGIAAGVLTDEGPTSTDINMSDVLKTGVTRRTMSVLTHYTDADSGAGEYHITTGVEVTGFNFDISVNAMVTGSFPTMGRGYAADTALPAGSTFNAISETEPFAGIDGRLLQDGVLLGFVTSVNTTNDNAQSAQFEIGDDEVSFIEKGRANNTLSLSSFFLDSDQLNKFINETEVSLVTILEGVDGALSFEYPVVKYTSGAPEVAGEESVTQTMEAQATGTATQSSLEIRRILAA